MSRSEMSLFGTYNVLIKNTPSHKSTVEKHRIKGVNNSSILTNR